MSTLPATPRTERRYVPTTPQTGTPVIHRAMGSSMVQPSPHYTTTRRHSLYGIEDRIVIDPGSRIWKVGFSGEGKPRDVLYAGGDTVTPLWTLGRAPGLAEREEEERLLEARVQERLSSLLTDPKSRKILLVEHPLLPLYVKEMLARILFNNLQVPSISFVPSSLLSLLAVGRITGLVVDCGHLESTALPIFASRPLYPHLRTTPLAGARFSTHLRALLLLFGTYLPPPTTLSGAVNLPASTRASRVPPEILTDTLLEVLKTRCCLVGTPLDAAADMRFGAPSEAGDGGSELDIPPSEMTPSEPDDISRMSMDVDSASNAASSSFSIVSHARAGPGADRTRGGADTAEGRLEALASMYSRHSTATDLRMRVVPPAAQQTGTGRGTLVIPGWIRERAAEVLFEGGDVDESSVAETILDSLLKVPMDLRKTLASSIVLTGGTAMLPGFIPRLHAELIKALASVLRFSRPPTRPGRPLVPVNDRYAPLRPLLPYFAILNNPSPGGSQSSAASAAGKAPAFSPASLAWVGGSLAGSLKIGGTEINRERWDAADPSQHQEDPDDSLMFVIEGRTQMSSVLPDWTRSPLPAGAPGAMRAQPVMQVSSPAAAVGA